MESSPSLGIVDIASVTDVGDYAMKNYCKQTLNKFLVLLLIGPKDDSKLLLNKNPETNNRHFQQ